MNQLAVRRVPWRMARNARVERIRSRHSGSGQPRPRPQKADMKGRVLALEPEELCLTLSRQLRREIIEALQRSGLFRGERRKLKLQPARRTDHRLPHGAIFAIHVKSPFLYLYFRTSRSAVGTCRSLAES
jgi:hypothetical protein